MREFPIGGRHWRAVSTADAPNPGQVLREGYGATPTGHPFKFSKPVAMEPRFGSHES